MKRYKKNLMKVMVFSVLPMVCLLAAEPSWAQSSDNYDLSWSTIDGGGGTSTVGKYVLRGTIGQPGVGEMSQEYVLTGGFWFKPGCVVDLEDLCFFAGLWLNSGDVDANFDWEDNPQQGNLVDLYDYSYLTSYWLGWCPDDWPW